MSPRYPGTLPPHVERRIRALEEATGVDKRGNGKTIIVSGSRSTGGGSGTGVTTLEYPISPARTVWKVKHDLGRYPACVTVNDSGVRIFGEEKYTSKNEIVITFSAAVSGAAYLV